MIIRDNFYLTRTRDKIKAKNQSGAILFVEQLVFANSGWGHSSSRSVANFLSLNVGKLSGPSCLASLMLVMSYGFNVISWFDIFCFPLLFHLSALAYSQCIGEKLHSISNHKKLFSFLEGLKRFDRLQVLNPLYLEVIRVCHLKSSNICTVARF